METSDDVVKAIPETIGMLIEQRARLAIKYLSPKLIVRACRKRYRGKILKGSIEIILTIGKPNYKEREFIKKCKKVGEPFPIERVQLKYPS
jgi:hypothetical protein